MDDNLLDLLLEAQLKMVTTQAKLNECANSPTQDQYPSTSHGSNLSVTQVLWYDYLKVTTNRILIFELIFVG